MFENKIYRVITIIMILVMILGACKSSKKAEPTTKTTSAPEHLVTDETFEDPWANVDPSGQTINFWHNYTGNRVNTINEIVDEFNSTNPYDITVNQEYQGSYNVIYNKMLTSINTPDVPGVVVAYQDQAATYQIANALVDMNPLVNSPKWGLSQTEQADFFPGFWQQDIFPVFNGARLGFPLNRSMEVMYYNMDWLAELKTAGKIDFDGAPQTPEQFKAAACAAVKNPFSEATARGSIGYELGTGDSSHMAAWTFAFGGDIFDYTTDQLIYNSDAEKAALIFLRDLFKSGCATIITENYGDQTDFGAGKLLFTTSSTSGLAFYKSAVDSGAAFNWSVAAIPHTTQDPVMNIYGASVSIPKSTPQKELAAWLFIKYYTSPEAQAKWAKASAYFPVRASVAANLADYFTANPAYQAGFDLLTYGKFEPSVPGYNPIRNEASATVASLLADPYPDVTAALDELTKKANEILSQYVAIIQTPVPTTTAPH